jgi:DNA adenine methylase
MITAKVQRKFLFTPLRYPGGKTSLFEYFDDVIKYNNLKDVCYIEPYAGGAGAALSLLLLEKVERIVINDYDKAIYSFWKSILEHTEEFVQLINDTPLTIEEWRKQKSIYTNGSENTLELGFATFYLNRTNRSGILTGGPIGGIGQKGKWLLDARFNKPKLIERIRLISLYSDRITVLNQDGLDVIRAYADKPSSFFYIDPPYYDKGQCLYLNSYGHKDHEALANLLNGLKGTRWILSYDNVPPIRELYRTRKKQYEFSLHYQAHSSKEGSELIVFSDSLAVPEVS